MHVARSMHPLSDKCMKPHPAYFERTKFPTSHPPPTTLHRHRHPIPLAYLFYRCMQSANVKCNICLSTYLPSSPDGPPRPSTTPSPPDSPARPSRSIRLSIIISRVVCVTFMYLSYAHMNFIDSCQSLVSGGEEERLGRPRGRVVEKKKGRWGCEAKRL